MVLLAIVVHFVLIVGIASFLFIRHRYGYWKAKGVCSMPPTFPYGCFEEVGKSLHFCDALRMHYQLLKTRGTYGGIYLAMRPIALICQLDLVKNILIRDFNYFTDRGIYYNEKDEPLSANLFVLDGEQWKSMRNKFSPLFTSGKIKFMFPVLVKLAERFQKIVQDEITISNEVDVLEFSSRFITDIIGTCAFGIECNSLEDPHTEFRVQAKRVLTEKRNNKFVEAISTSFTTFSRLIGIKTFPPKLHEYFMEIVEKTVKHREKNNIRQNDFMDLLIELKNDTKELTLEQIAAQTFLFFTTGYETSSNALSFVLYELAQHQHIQDKLRQDIMTTLENHDHNLTYESLTEMTFMEQVVNETLRLHPSVPYLIRKTIKDYPVPGSSRIIEKGITLLFPVQAIHLDEEIHLKPDVFDPERFSPERIKKMHPCAFIPFGDGPRNCLGFRFAKMQIFIGLIFLLKTFKFSTCHKTEIPVKLNLNSTQLTPKNGITLKVEKL